MSLVLCNMSFAVLGVFGTLFFAAIQGLLVWLLARSIAQLLPSLQSAAKVALIIASWFVWTIGGMFVWSLLGGSGGVFDGGMPVLVVIPTGIYGSVVAGVLWLLMKPQAASKLNG